MKVDHFLVPESFFAILEGPLQVEEGRYSMNNMKDSQAENGWNPDQAAAVRTHQQFPALRERARREQLKRVERLSYCQWLKPRSKSGLD